MYVFVINLESSKTRRDLTRDNLKLCGFQGVDFFNATPPEKIKENTDLFDKNFKYKDGTLACGISHVRLLKKIEQLNTDQPILIIEDDILLSKSSKALISLLYDYLKDNDPDWDLLYISWNTGSNTQRIWEGQLPLLSKSDHASNWDRFGQIIDFYFIRKIKTFSNTVKFYNWSEGFIDWYKNDALKYRDFQHLINQSAYIVNPKRIKNILSSILPLDKAIDIKILENYEKLNIYMLSPAFNIVSPNPFTAKESIRLNNDYLKKINFVWPQTNDILSRNHEYTFKVKMHKSLVYGEDINFIQPRCKIFINRKKIYAQISLFFNSNNDDFCEISFTLDKNQVNALDIKNNIFFIFETFWQKNKIYTSRFFFVE